MSTNENHTNWQNIKIASPYDDTPDSEIADKDELDQVANTGIIPPVDFQRFNPNLPYAEVSLNLSDKDQVLFRAIKKAIGNGWVGWRERVNDAVTIGYEAEELIREMKRKNTDVKSLVFDIDFCDYLWGKEYSRKHLEKMVVERDVVKYLEEHLDG